MNEKQVHKNICEYIRLQYPGVIFNTDLSGIRLPIGQATQLKKLRSSRAFPDLMIFEPREPYHGLFIELKADNVRLWKKNGDFATDHLREQGEMIGELKKRGYHAQFCVGFDSAKAVIDWYLKCPSKK